jgi:hypothetical protein
MKSAAVTILSLLLSSLQAEAQAAELTLNCQYESAYDSEKRQEENTTGDFSAVVRMQTLNNGTQIATIQATTVAFVDFVGSFDELQVYRDCERTWTSDSGSSGKAKANLRINRISGAFSHTVFFETTALIFSGHCTLGKKLF